MPLNNVSPQCTAKSKRSGKRCNNVAVNGFTVCRLHGAGNVNKGKVGGGVIKNGNYSHRYQALLSDKRAARFKAALEDTDFLNLIPRIGVLETRFLELLEKQGSKESGEVWDRLKQVVDEAEQVFRDKNLPQESKSQHFTEVWPFIVKLVREGVSEYYEWSEIRQIVEDTRKLVDTEAKRIKMMAEIVSFEEAKVLVERVLNHAQKRMEPKLFTALVYDLEQDLVGTYGKEGQREERPDQ